MSLDIKMNIIRKISTLSTGKDGRVKEINLISWNDAEPKYDIRSFSADHKKIGKGVTLSPTEALILGHALQKEFSTALSQPNPTPPKVPPRLTDPNTPEIVDLPPRIKAKKAATIIETTPRFSRLRYILITALIVFAVTAFAGHQSVRSLRADYEQQLTDAQNVIAEKSQEISSLNDAITDLIIDKDSLHAKRSSSASSSYSPSYSHTPKEQQELPADTDSDTVYVTEHGSKYHRSNCGYLKTKIALSFDDAISRGYTACSRCW